MNDNKSLGSSSKDDSVPNSKIARAESEGSNRPKSRPSDKVKRNPSGQSRKSDQERIKFEVDTRDKELDKAIVAEDPDEDYEADNNVEYFVNDDNKHDADGQD